MAANVCTAANDSSLTVSYSGKVVSVTHLKPLGYWLTTSQHLAKVLSEMPVYQNQSLAGVIFYETGGWHLETWDKQGKYNGTAPPHGWDLKIFFGMDRPAKEDISRMTLEDNTVWFDSEQNKKEFLDKYPCFCQLNPHLKILVKEAEQKTWRLGWRPWNREELLEHVGCLFYRHPCPNRAYLCTGADVDCLHIAGTWWNVQHLLNAWYWRRHPGDEPQRCGVEE